MTKKLLLSSTAIIGAVALATPALADIEVTLSGQVEFGTSVFNSDTVDLSDDDQNLSNRGYTFFMDSETKIQAEGAADNGVNYSAKVELETDADSGGSEAFNADEAVLAFWGSFGRVELGRDDGAEDVMYVGGEDFQAGTGGIDGDAANLDLANINDSGDSTKVTYFTPRVGGFQLGASYTPDEDDEETGQSEGGGAEENSVGVGANFEAALGGADVTFSGVAIFADDEDDGDDKEDYAVGVGAEFAGLGIGAGYIFREDDDEADGFNIGAKYGFGPLNASIGWAYEDDDDSGRDGSVVAVSADYGLYPGVTLKGDVAWNSDDADSDDDNDDGDFEETVAGILTIQIDY